LRQGTPGGLRGPRDPRARRSISWTSPFAMRFAAGKHVRSASHVGARKDGCVSGLWKANKKVQGKIVVFSGLFCLLSPGCFGIRVGGKGRPAGNRGDKSVCRRSLTFQREANRFLHASGIRRVVSRGPRPLAQEFEGRAGPHPVPLAAKAHTGRVRRNPEITRLKACFSAGFVL